MTIKNLYPVIEPSLNLDFANSKKLDPRITFTRGSIGTYVGDDGLIKTAAQNEARFDHDSDGNSLGLLVEESRTNYVIYSEQINLLAGPQSGSDPPGNYTFYAQPNAISAPDGTQTGTYLSLGYFGGPQQSLSSQPEQTYTISAWVRRVPGKSLGDASLNISTPGTERIRVITAAETSENEWRRITFTGTLPAGNHTFRIMRRFSQAYLYVWGFQAEIASFPTSYIPTSGSTVTRAADVASITGSNFSSWYNQSEGTYFLDATTVDSGTTDDILYDGYVTIRDYIGAGIRRRSITSPLVGGVYQFVFNPAQAPVSKVAVAFDSTSANAAYAGILQTLDTSVSDLPNSATSLTIGGTVPFQMNKGHISRLTYYPQRLPDATLQAMTL